MEEFLSFVAWVVFEVVLIQTGRFVVWAGSFGRWRGESLGENEGRVFAAAGALSFVREGRRVVTTDGLLFAGIAFYIGVVVLLVAYAASV